MATVSTNTNWGAIGYSAGEDIDIDSGAVLTIDAQVPADVTALATLPGNVRCITSGKLRVVNTSTTDPICLTLQNNNDDFRFEKNGIFEVRGAPIELGTGTGLAGQTFDLSSAPLDVIPYPSYVEVETASGSGFYLPWWTICTAGTPITHQLSDFCGGTDPITGDKYPAGNVFAWNATTRQLSVGDDTNGNVIPSGCKVRIPNIYLHSNVNNATPTSRTLLDLNPAGRFDGEWCAFSDAIYADILSHSYFRAHNVGFCGVFASRAANADCDVDGFANSPDTQTDSVVLWAGRFDGMTGSVKLRRISTLLGRNGSNGVGTYFWKLPGLTSADGTPKIEYVNAGRVNGRVNTNVSPLNVLNLPQGTVLNNISTSGGVMPVANCVDITFLNTKIADEIGTVQQTSLNTYGFGINNCQKVKIIELNNAGLTVPRIGVVFSDDQCLDLEIFNADFDARNTARSIFAGSGSKMRAYNSTIRNVAAFSVAGLLDATGANINTECEMLNIRATGAAGFNTDTTNRGVLDVCASDGAVNTIFSVGNGVAFSNCVDAGLTPTTGAVYFGPFGTYAGLVLTGQAGYDQAGAIEFPQTGDTIECESLFIMHAITSFQNTAPLWSYTDTGGTVTASATPPTGVTAEFRLRNPGGVYGSYLTLDAANLSGAIAALSGYDSDDGLYMQIRLTATTTDAARIMRQIKIPTNVDNTYSAPDATITLLGPATTDVTTLYRYSDDSVIAAFTGSGAKSFAAAADFGAQAYLVRRDSGGFEIMRTRSNPFTISLGDNGTYSLFAGEEIQLVQAPDVTAIKAAVDAYLDAAISSRATELGVWGSPSRTLTADPGAAAHAATQARQTTINNGLKKASLLIPHSEDL